MSSLSHKAQVDSEGNIILPGVSVDGETTMEEGVWYAPPEQPEPLPAFQWDDTGIPEAAPAVTAQEEEYIELPVTFTGPAHVPQQPVAWSVEETTQYLWADVRGQIYRVTSDVVAEGARQTVASIQDGKRVSHETAVTARSSAARLWSFLTQPVWVPGRRSQPVSHSRGVLFMLDTVRFGGTFAGIFTLLFVGLNYQSFWTIAQSYVDPLAEVTGVKDSGDDLGRGVADKLKKIPSLAVAGQDESSMLDFLPAVGPPDDRLIIPRLNLNVPIVIPSSAALISEDWKKLEEDIQHALEDGVAHYPGTARPGQAGNFFMTGHSSYFPWAPGDYKSVFARLHELKVGDEYWVFYGGDRHRYIIQEKKEIKPSDVSVLDQPTGKRISTLMTCTPVGTTLRRLILNAQEVDPVTGLALEVGERTHQPELPKTRLEMLPI